MPGSRTPIQPPKPRTRGASRYKCGETKRLLKGALDAGLRVTGLEVDPVTGCLRVLVGNSDASGSSPSQDAADAK
jgi:hypothetical protein